MIMQWKKASSIEYTAAWNARFLSLRWEGDCWRLYVDGAQVRGSWPTPLAAQNAVDNVQQRIVARLMARREEVPGGAATIN